MQLLRKKNGRKELKESIDYFWVFKNLKSVDKCCLVSKMLYDELCMIDKRFMQLKKRDLKPMFDGDKDCYVLVNSGEKWLNE